MQLKSILRREMIKMRYWFEFKRKSIFQYEIIIQTIYLNCQEYLFLYLYTRNNQSASLSVFAFLYCKS